MKFKTENKYFTLDDEKFFLHSAEMQYFRIKKDKWSIHIKKIKDAGCNTVTTYIPWDWHESVEGEFDFTGETVPEKDLIGWLDLCKDAGLYNILKPGPYILAEYVGAGIPEWFINNYREECEVKNSMGQKGQDDVMSFMHPKYLEYSMKWFDKIMPIIAKRQLSNNGNIIMMQVCNEVGVFTWLKKQADYSSHCIKMYHSFLENKYNEISKLNNIYDTKYQSFSEIIPPKDTGYNYLSNQEIAIDIDWHSFWRFYYAEYLRYLMKEIRQRGVDVQFYHNLPGWIYGRGHDFPINITMYDELYKDYPDIVLGVDHIPENISYRNFHDDMIINEIVWAQQGGRGPLFGAEFQAGSREYCTFTFPGELDLFYKASFANGLCGWNYYMFSSGKNPNEKGTSGESFYWFTPLDHEGNEGSLYPVCKKTGNFIKTFGKDVVSMEKKSDICVLFYRQYYASELAKDINFEGSDINFDYTKIRNQAYFEGLLKVLQLLNIDFDMLDAEHCSIEELQKYKQVWMFSCDIMGSKVQEKLSKYLDLGGNLAIYPTMPKYDISMKKCRILADKIGVRDLGIKRFDMPKIKAFETLDLIAANPMCVYEKQDNIILKTLDGECCGFIKDIGKGRVLVSGTFFGFAIEEHKNLYIKMIESLRFKINKHAGCQGDRLIIKQRFDDNEKISMLFVGNYFNELEQDRVYYTHPETQEKYTIPLSGEKMSIPGISGFLSIINKNLIKGINLLHTTSDIIDIEINENKIIIRFLGVIGLIGETAFCGKNTKKISNISLNGEKLKLSKKDSVCCVNYEHGQSEQELILEMSS